MDRFLYFAASLIVRLLQSLPLLWVARLGRLGGAAAYRFDKRHRHAALGNLARCFPEKTEIEHRALAKENFRRIGENLASAIRTSRCKPEDITAILEVAGVDKLRFPPAGTAPESRIVAIGHFGNFELFAHCFLFVRGYRFATTYRALRQASLNRLFQQLREKSGCEFFERRMEGEALRRALNAGGILLGLLSDQHAGDRGLELPFFGQPCSTSAAPAVLALRYQCPLFTAICYRTGLARWRIEVGDEIPTTHEGKVRSPEAIMLDVNRAFETAVRKDPANWFWVHKRWKPGKARRVLPKRVLAESTGAPDRGSLT